MALRNPPRAQQQDDPSLPLRRAWAGGAGSTERSRREGVLARGGFWLGVALCGIALAGCSGSTSGPVQPTGVGPAAKVVFTVQPSNAVAGGVITPAVQVAIQDAQGNTVTTATTSITVAIGTNPASGTLSGTTTVAAVSGVATFSNLSLNPAGTGYTLTASATGLTGATSGTVAVSAAGGSVSITFCSALAPIWLAVQDGDGAWTRVLPNSGTTTYELSVPSGKGGLAFVYSHNILAATGTYLYVTYADFTPQGFSSADVGMVCGSRTVNGSVANVGATEQATVTLGEIQAGASPGAGTFPLYQLSNVGSGPQDLFAGRGAFSGTTFAVNKVILRRALSPADNSTLALLDFDADGFVPASANVTVTGLGADSAFVSSSFTARLGSGLVEGGGVLNSFVYRAASGAQPYAAIPLAQLTTNDIQYLIAGATGANAGREAWLFFRNPLNQTLALGPDLNTPTVTKLVTAPNARPRVQLASQTEYNRLIVALFTQTALNRGVFVQATPGYYGGVPATWDVTMPDLSAAAGGNSAWGLRDGTPIEWSVLAQGGALLGGDLATDGSTSQDASRWSSTPLTAGALSTALRGFMPDRRLLNALRLRAASPSRP